MQLLSKGMRFESIMPILASFNLIDDIEWVFMWVFMLFQGKSVEAISKVGNDLLTARSSQDFLLLYQHVNVNARRW